MTTTKKEITIRQGEKNGLAHYIINQPYGPATCSLYGRKTITGNHYVLIKETTIGFPNYLDVVPIDTESPERDANSILLQKAQEAAEIIGKNRNLPVNPIPLIS